MTSGGKPTRKPDGRIRKAEETGALELDLRRTCINSTFARVATSHFAPIARPHRGQTAQTCTRWLGLPSLQSFDPSWCIHLVDFSALAGITSLQKLDLHLCNELRNLSLLAKLASLKWLDLGGCTQISDQAT